MAQGEFARTMKHLLDGLEHTADWVRDNDIYTMLADAAALARDPAALKDYVAKAEESSALYNQKLNQAIVQRAKGVGYFLDGDFNNSRNCLEQALQEFLTYETHWQTGRTYAELGEVAVQQGKKEEARRYFEQAIQEYSLLGAQPGINRLKQLLEEL